MLSNGSALALPKFVHHFAPASLCLLFAFACADGPKEPPALEVFPVGTPSVGAIFQREFVGQVQAARRVEFRARHKGVVELLGVDEGQPVKAGQVLFSISARELQQELVKAQAAVASAAAEVKAAQVEVTNTRVLVDNKVLSNAELELGEAKLAALEARVREAKANEGQAEVNLSFARVVAPFDGVVNRLPRKVGSLVLEDELLTTLTDTSEVFIYFRVSEHEFLDIAALVRGGKEPVTLLLANGTRYSHEGTIDAVESEFDTDSGNIAFRARFPNPERLLKHGATGKVVIRSNAPDALVVPQSSTFEIQENVYVFSVDSNDTVRATRIVPRARVKNGFVLESGLAPTDRIVLEGTQRLKDGAHIVARVVATPSGSAL